MVNRKKIVIPIVACLLILSAIFVIQKRYNFVILLPKPIKEVMPLRTRHNFSTIKVALENANYSKYPAYSVPVQGTYKSLQFNPKTKTQLVLDTSEGGGYKCCEAPTFYVWVDRKDNIFWIETYQAGLGSVNDYWYGPFKLEVSN